MPLAPDSEDEKVLLPWPCAREKIAPATQFRTTWIVSSLEGLRLHGHFDRYLELLAGHRDEILQCVAGAWLPLPIVRAHYEACDRLELTAAELELMAREGGATRRAWHATIIAAAQQPGASIWTILQQLQKLWLRSADGGAAAVFQLAPNRVRVEYAGCELFDIQYFGDAVGAVLLLLGEHLCKDVQLDCQHRKLTASGSATFLMRWAP